MKIKLTYNQMCMLLGAVSALPIKHFLERGINEGIYLIVIMDLLLIAIFALSTPSLGGN